MFTLLLALAALLVAGSTAYFSTLGIATLFSGRYLQVLIMAGCLEFGKLVATSFLYRYWNKAPKFLKIYLTAAVIVLMIITSMGVYGYLSSAYQVNASKTGIIDNKVVLIQQQKTTIDGEIKQISERIDTLNQSRLSQEKRLSDNKVRSTLYIYNDIKRAGEEIKGLNSRLQELQKIKFEKDNDLINLQGDSSQVHDIGTFKFIAQSFNQPVDTVVKWFILILVSVLDPLAVSLVLALNVATRGTVLKEVDEVVEDKQSTTRKFKIGGIVGTGFVKQR
jgi:hypothetical protein